MADVDVPTAPYRAVQAFNDALSMTRRGRGSRASRGPSRSAGVRRSSRPVQPRRSLSLLIPNLLPPRARAAAIDANNAL